MAFLYLSRLGSFAPAVIDHLDSSFQCALCYSWTSFFAKQALTLVDRQAFFA